MNPVLSPGSELVPVGDCVCLFEPVRHAAALLNPAGAASMAAYLSGDGAALAPDMVGALDAAGFFAEPAASHRVQGFESEPTAGAVLRRYRLGAAAADLTVDDRRLAGLIGDALRPLEVATPENGARPRLRVEGSDDEFAIWRDGVRIVGGLGFGDARRIAIQALMMALVPPDGAATILHASAVATPDGAVVLAGATGSGKSTLTLGLSAAGHTYLGDDLLPLDRTGTRLTAFPTAASVKAGSADLVAARFPGLRGQREHAVGPRRVRYLPVPGARADTRIDARVCVLVFPTYGAEAPDRAWPLAPEEALLRLLESGTEVVGAPRSIRPLAKLVETAPAYALAFSSLDAAVGIVEGLVEGNRP